jgi:4-hydroxy-tetrahydrodipicolinate synthase
MSTKPRFGEVITAMVTPFRPDGSLDLVAAREMATYLVEHGSDGLVVCGTTGESPTLTRPEKLSLFEAVLETVGDRASVIAGTGTYDTAETVELTKEAGDLGAHACLIVTPYYSRPPQNGLLAHFSHVADESSVPLMIYDIPGRTARRVERPTMLTLAKHEKIVAVKDAVGDPIETAKLRRELDDSGSHDFEIYSGDDVLLMPHLSSGAVGIVSVCSHLIGPQIKQMCSAWADGKVEEAKALYLRYLPLMSVIMGVTSSPIPVKHAVGLLGHPAGDVRLPLVPPTEDEADTIRKALEDAGLL